MSFRSIPGDRAGVALLVMALVAASVFLSAGSCGTAPTPFIVQGQVITGNDPPEITFRDPVDDITRDQGSVFLIRWVDRDRDSNARIGFSLLNTQTNSAISLVQGLDENDTSGTDSVTVNTSAVPIGTYNLRAIITDGINAPVEVFAQSGTGGNISRIIVNIVAPGGAPPTNPPSVAITEPAFNLSVAQDDILQIVIQPSILAPNADIPFDRDSDARLTIMLDTDQNPNNDDPANPGDDLVILQTQNIAEDASAAIPFSVPINLSRIPPRPGGEPYFIRATLDDESNPPVSAYAVGRISVVQLASGTVDLSEIGTRKAGATFKGFSPGAQTGSTAASIGDFDNDGIQDFILVAQFGNPRNFGLIGEAYVVYGQPVRFGNTIQVNTIGEAVSGFIVEGTPVRRFGVRDEGNNFRPLAGDAVSNGITSVGFVADLTGDGRPEILIGASKVFGAFDSMDYDPGDEDPLTDATEEVEVELSQGRFSQTIGDDPTIITAEYLACEDVTLSTASASISLGSNPSLSWRNDGGTVEWTMLKFSDVLDFIPDANDRLLIDETTLTAELELRIFDGGPSGNLHALLRDFDEQATLTSFGTPVSGRDYEAVAIESINAENPGPVIVNMTTVVQQLFAGVLPNDEIRLIIVAPAGAANQVQSRSSEAATSTTRPLLRINYQRFNIFGSQGCYPDPWVNNQTTQLDIDLYTYSGGMACMLNSQNRDDESVTGINTMRLEETSVVLELIGQENWPLDADGINSTSGGILVRADNSLADVPGNDSIEPDRISGARFVAGWFDTVDHLLLRQGPREDLFGSTVSSIGDLNNDGLDEIVISAPRNERHLEDLFNRFGTQSTHWRSTGFRGSVVVIPGDNYSNPVWREKNDAAQTSTIPVFDHFRFPFPGLCSDSDDRLGPFIPADSFEVFAEDIDDMLGGATSAKDFNQDGVDDLLCGAFLNNRPNRADAGAVYIIYGRNVFGDVNLELADNVLRRPPMLRIRGVKVNDQIGWRQVSGLDVNGDRIDDVFLSSPRTDFGTVNRTTCAGDFNGDGDVTSDDVTTSAFTNCRNRFRSAEEDLFSNDSCKVFDYDNDRDIDDQDRTVFECLLDSGVETATCCTNLVDNGFVGIVFGGVFTDGDRDITQIGTPDLPGTKFFGSGPLHRAGADISSAGDFNQDGFGDLLVAVPGETRRDEAGRERLGVVYLVFGGTHLYNTTWNLTDVGSADLPGIVMISPYLKGRPNEAAPTTVSFLGDVNDDGFGDIFVGNPLADFIDRSFPQGPDAPGTDAGVGRRRNAGDGHLIYGNNFGSNRSAP